MENHQLVLILDFGGQYNHLVARRVREQYVYCEVKPYDIPIAQIRAMNPIGIILTGGKGSPSSADAPVCDPAVFELGIPVLGIGYGHALMTQLLGGEAAAAQQDHTHHEMPLTCDTACKLFAGLPAKGGAHMASGGFATRLPADFVSIGQMEHLPHAAIADEKRGFYGVQFHPEISGTQHGAAILKNFLYDICGAAGDWTMADYKKAAIDSIRAQVGSGKVLLALSGGVDSSVAAALLAEAIGNQLTCVFVDHGLMRKNEGDEVEAAFSKWNLHFIRVSAEQRFLDKLSGVTDPEAKRKIIGEEFIRVFESESRKIGSVDYLAQGTIYPDVIESGGGDAAVIKSHHNVGGLPDYVDFKEIIEPLRPLFKDEVRQLGRELALPEYLVMRQPFPGPGLGIRVLGEITKEKLTILREADFILRDEIAKAKLEHTMNQYFAVLTSLRSVGMTDGARTYDYTLALRSVTTTDFMTADWTRIPHEVLDLISVRITSEVKHINRIVYDITSKPPSTIEWE